MLYSLYSKNVLKFHIFEDAEDAREKNYAKVPFLIALR